MQNNAVSRISVEIPNGKPSRFSLSHDVNTSYDWGSVQPLFGKLMLPDSSLNVNLEQLTRLAPMVVPTFGRVKMKNFAHFIRMSDIWPNWDAMMSQTKVTRPSLSSSAAAANTYVPKYVPCIHTNFLTAFCLAGAKVNVYFSGVVGSQAEDAWTCVRNNGSFNDPSWAVAQSGVRELLNVLLGISYTESPSLDDELPNWQNYKGPTMRVNRLLLTSDNLMMSNAAQAREFFTVPTISTLCSVPMGSADISGFTHSAGNERNNYDLSRGDEHITFKGADMIWEFAGSGGEGITYDDRRDPDSPVYGLDSNFFDSCKIRIVFKLSSFGKRLRKVLIGLGYNINFQDSTVVSLLPLFAYYKAWFDRYAPQRVKNFYETPCWKLIQVAMSSATAPQFYLNYLDSSFVRAYFAQFISELGSLFATDKLDVVGAATDAYYGATNSTVTQTGGAYSWETDLRKTVQDQLDMLYQFDDSSVIYTNGSSHVTFSEASGSSLQNGELVNSKLQSIALTDFGSRPDGFGGDIRLTQPQLDALKKAYLMLNKSSVAGMRTAEILRALGYGDYVEECNGRFIDDYDTTIKISDVISTSDTEGAKLGQYGGRGLGVGEMHFSYSTKYHGILVILSTVVPLSGYVNAPSRELEAISFETMFNPELDGLAYEAIEKKCLVGSPVLNDASCNDTFGFLPTYTAWKFMSNKANGDFSLNSMKTKMTPFSLDKYVPVDTPNSYRVEETNGHPGSTTEFCSKVFKYSDLANAGEDYRFVNKFPWNGDYNRIFADKGDGLEWSIFSPNNSAFLFNSFEYDNFMCHNVFTITYWAHMKSIEDSYSTYDNEHGAPNTSIAKC